jgi:hypothetical protein
MHHSNQDGKNMIDIERSAKPSHDRDRVARLRGPLGVKGSGVLVIALVLLGLIVFSGTPALANSGHAFLKAFAAKGSGAGQLEDPNGVAVNDTTHDLYVADSGNHRIDEFNAEGTFIRAWGWGVADGLSMLETCGPEAFPPTATCQQGLSGTEAGEFENPAFVAVDNAAGGEEGDVYVADTGTGLITKFTAEGALVKSWSVGGQLGTAPITVATATGNLINGSTTVGELTATSGSLHSTADISGEGIQPGTRLEFNRHLSQPATITKEHVVLTAQRSLGGYAGIAVDTGGDLWIGTRVLALFRNSLEMKVTVESFLAASL